MGRSKKDWIQCAVSKNPGSLHRSLHVPEGKKIPEKKIDKAIHSKNLGLRRKALLAKTLKKIRDKSGK